MKLAPATFSIVRIDPVDRNGRRRGQSGSNIRRRLTRSTPSRFGAIPRGLSPAGMCVQRQVGSSAFGCSTNHPPTIIYVPALVEPCDGCPQPRGTRRCGGGRQSPAVTNLSANP